MNATMLTRTQSDIIKQLRGGGRLRSELDGWRQLASSRRLHYTTQEAIEVAMSGELSEVTFRGRYLTWSLVVHRDYVDQIIDVNTREGSRNKHLWTREI